MQKPAEAEPKQETKKPLPVKKEKQEIKISAPNLSPKDIACLAGENPEIAELLNEAQEAYGRTISPSEQEMIVNLVTFYGLSYGAVLMLLGYCRREREAGRAISAGYFYKIAEKWLDDCFDRKERLWRNGKENGIQTYWEEKEEDQDECYRPEWTIEEIELEN